MSRPLFTDLRDVMRRHMAHGMSQGACAELHLRALEWLVISVTLAGVPPEQIQAAVERGREAVRRTQN